MKKNILLALCAVCIPSIAAAQLSVGGVQQLSVAQNGGAPLGNSGDPATAPNGKILVFDSRASNLVPHDTNLAQDVFIRNLSNNSLALASLSSTQAQANKDCNEPAVSAVGPDGFFAVAFASEATNLSSLAGTSGAQNIFVRFPTSGLTVPATIGTDGKLANDDCSAPSISATFAPNQVSLVYESIASNLTHDSVSGINHIYLTAVTPPASASQNPVPLVTTKLITIGSGGAEADSDSNTPKISGDGNWVVFSSLASNLIAGQTITGQQIYLYNAGTGEISLLSKTQGGVAGNGGSTLPVISYSGRFVAFLTNSSNLVSSLQFGHTAAVIVDRTTGSITRVDSAQNGTPGDGSAETIALSANGRFVTFTDSSTNLLNSPTNGNELVFIKDLQTNAIALASHALSGLPNDDSDSAVMSGTAYNALSGVVSFRSFATNLTNTQSNGGGDVYITGAKYVAALLTQTTRLETPPDVRVSGKTVSIGVQKFRLAQITAGELGERAAPNQKLLYDIRIAGKGNRRRTHIEQINSRNSATVKNLPPGTYTAQYRPVTQTNGKTTPASPFSPRQTFQAH